MNFRVVREGAWEMIFSHEERKFVRRPKTNGREVEVVKHSAIKGGAAPLLIIKFQSDNSADVGWGSRASERARRVDC